MDSIPGVGYGGASDMGQVGQTVLQEPLAIPTWKIGEKSW